MPPEELTRRLKALATELGFSLAGVAPAVRAPGADRLDEWLAYGYAGQMGYLADRRDAYDHPSGVLDGAKSVLMLTLDYLTEEPEPPEPGEARVSRYAWGDADYHDLIRPKLHQLADTLREWAPGATARGVVDTAPLMERDFAQLAGLGWIGKNTLLLSRELGSTVFLAEILTDLDLPTGDRSADHCGSCTSCLDRCPTKAFPAPYVLDARRCISYLTIEYRGVIDRELRSAMGAWIFGCDICQDVCPWNKFAQAATAAGARAAADLTSPDLAHLMTLDADAFRERFRRSPIWRAGRDGFLRNVAIALGNSRCEEAVAPLRLGLEDGSPLVRLHAAWALGEASEGQPYAADVRARLLARREIENDEAVRDEIDHASDRLSADPG